MLRIRHSHRLLLLGFLWLAPSFAVSSARAQAPPRADPFQAPAKSWPKDAKTGLITKFALEGVQHPSAFYHVGVPKDYSPEKEWPLVMVLHGSNGSADNLVTVFQGFYQQRGAITVYPQALEKQLLAWNYPDHGAYFLQIIRQVGKTYRIDPTRIYLVGHSMGGGGAWTMGAVLSDVWAGIGPLSGWYLASPRPPAEWLKEVPIYAIHGDKDPAVIVQNSQQAVEVMKKLGIKVKVFREQPGAKDFDDATFVYRELPGVGHDVFNPWQERGGPELARLSAWLLAHKRAKPADLAAAEKRLAVWGKSFGWTPEGGPLGKYEKK